MKKLLIILILLIALGGGAAWFLLKPKADVEAETTPMPEESYVSHMDLPVMPVPILIDGNSKGALFLKMRLLFLSQENENKARKYLPYLFDHLLKEMHAIAPHKSIAGGNIQPQMLEGRLQIVVDHLLGEKIATIRVIDIGMTDKK